MAPAALMLTGTVSVEPARIEAGDDAFQQTAGSRDRRRLSK
jgi:hypothetical protein